MADKPTSLEQTGIDTPDLGKIKRELTQAQADSSLYRQRIEQVKGWWFCEWDNQSIDGRRWPDPYNSGQKVFPWDGASDSRLRIVDTIIKEHVTLCLAAFWSSKKQAKSIRPFVSGREVNVAQNMLDWRLGQMKREMLRECNQALNWRFGAGLSFLKIEWEQRRDRVYVPISVDMIRQLTQMLGLSDVMDKLLSPDKAFDKDLIQVLQSLSPTLDTDEARTILTDLRTSGQSELPTVELRVNKPKWTARRPFYDIIFPSETAEIQQTRFTNERELVSEVELIDRIATDGYDPDFVDEALKHKGTFGNWWSHIPQLYMGSDRDLIELNHFLNWKIVDETPCLYRTVFNQSVTFPAKHVKFEYDHGQIPFVAMRRTYIYRPLLSSVGIAEEAYTDERDIKQQQDGLNDHTDIVRQPPMTVPFMRAQAMMNGFAPRSIMVSPRAPEWPPLPPWDQTPLMAMQLVQQRLDRRYPISSAGGGVDPSIVALHRQQLTSDTNAEFELALEQTLQLMQQYESDQDIQAVCGQNAQFKVGRKDIQGQHTISAAIDINMIDIERAEKKLGMLAQIMPFKQSGGKVFNAAATMVDADLADDLTADEMSPVAQQREKDTVYNAMGQIFSGVEPQQNMMINPQQALQNIQEILSDPETMAKMQQDQTIQKRVQNYMSQFQNQIQQFSTNPQIGRQLATQTFKPQTPPQLAAAPAQ